MQIVELPDGTEAEFPDDMDDAAITAVIRKKFPPAASKAAAPAAPAAPEESGGLIGLIGSAARAVGGLVDGAPDAIRNVPIVPPEGKEKTVLDRMASGERAPAPDGIGDFTWARVTAKERAEPLDPRMAAIAPADNVARAEQLASQKANAANASYARIMAKAREDNALDARNAKLDAEKYSAKNLAGNTVKNVRNVAAAALKIGPTAVKGVADIGRLMSADKVGKDTSDYLAEGMKAIDQVVAHASLTEQGKEFGAMMADQNASVGDLFGYLADNPEVLVDQGITTIGSMFLPAGVAAGTVRGGVALGMGANAIRGAATTATIGTIAAQNASDTFTSESLKNESMGNRYQAAMVSAAVSMLAGIATKGGAEGEIARRIAGDLTAGRTTLQAAGKFIAAAGKEGAQEAGEEFGNALGEQVGTGRVMLDPNNTMKRMAFAATLGAAMGGGTHLALGENVAPDDGSAAAEAARQAALAKWGTNGLSPNGAPAAPGAAPAAPGGRVEPTWSDVAGQPPAAAPAATIADIGAATTVDEAIAAAQAVVSTPHATAADIDALEQAAGIGAPAAAAPAPVDTRAQDAQMARELGLPDDFFSNWEDGPAAAPGNDPAAMTGENLPAPGQAAPVLDSAGKNQRSPSVWRMAADIPTLTDRITPDVDQAADWHAFPTETGTLGIPRAEMPQIKAEHRGAMTQFLNARGITHEQVEVPADSLKPTQAEFSLSKVQKAIDYEGGNRSILVSSDGHVLDGHHQWLAAAEQGAPVKAIRLNAPIAQLLDAVREFPSAGVDTSSAPAAPSTGIEAARQKHQRQDDEVRQAAANAETRLKSPGSSPDAAWRSSEFAPRIQSMADELRAAGDEGMARAIMDGAEVDARNGQLTESTVAFREGKARQTIARRAATAGGNIKQADIEPMTAERFIAEKADTAGALPRPIVDAAVAKWNAIAPQLAKLGYKDGEVHSDAAPEARDLQRQLTDIVQAMHGLAPRRYQQAKHGEREAKAKKAGKKVEKFDKKHLDREEDNATRVLGIDTRKHRGVDASNPITLGAGVSNPEVRSLQAKQQAKRLRDRLQRDNPFLAFLANHGVSLKDQADIGLEKGRKGNRMAPGYGPVLRHAGKRLDELALLAVDEGFLTQQDVDANDDTGGTRKLADMIQRAVAGREVIQPAGMLEADMPTTDQRLQDEARSLDIDTDGKTAEQVYDEVVAAHAALEQQRQAIEAATGEAITVEDQATVEDVADSLSPAAAALAVELLQDADIPLDGGLSSDNITDEELDAIFGLQSRPGSSRNPGDAGQAVAEPAPAVAGGTAAPGGDLLSSYTPAEVRARQDSDEAATKARQAERDKLEAQRKKERDDADIRARQDASAENFQLGQDAMDSLAGQGGLFDASAPAAPAKAAAPDIAITDELLAIAERETAGIDSMLKWDMLEDQQGVMPGKPTQINRALKKGTYTLDEMRAAWTNTREHLRQQYGNTVTLYRAEAPREKWNADTQVVYMGDKKLAKRFANDGRTVEAYTVDLNDVIGLNVQRNGYYEFIVKRQGEPFGASTASESGKSATESGKTATNPGKSAKSGTEYDALALRTDFQVNPVEILEALGQRGDLKALYKAGGVRNADAFGDMPLADQANAYVKLVQSGTDPVAVEGDYNEKVARAERDAVVRRLQGDNTVTQQNGKPFKSEKSAIAFQQTYDLEDTHEIEPKDKGFVLKRLPPARRPSVLREIAERQMNDPETRRQEDAFERAAVIGTAADSLVEQYQNGDLEIEAFEAGLSKIENGGKAATAMASDADIDAMFDTVLEEVEAKPTTLADEKAKVAKARKPRPPAPAIPLAFYKRVKVDQEVFVADEGVTETIQVPADQALANVAEDITNLEALIKCMKG